MNHLRNPVAAFAFVLSMAFPPSSGAQYTPALQHKIDSLQTVIKSAPHDSIAVNAYFAWDDMIYLFDPMKDLELNAASERICRTALAKKLPAKEEHYFKTKLASSLNNLGLGLLYQGKNNDAKVKLLECVEIRKSTGDIKGLAAPYQNLGIVSKNMGNLNGALDFYNKSLEANKAANNKAGQANSYDNMGNVFAFKGDFNKAISYYSKSLKIREEIKDERGIGISMHNMSITNIELGEYENALDLVEKCIAIRKKINDPKGLAESFSLKGTIAFDGLKNHALSDSCYLEGLRLCEEIGNQKCRAQALVNLAANAAELGEYSLAENYYSQCVEIWNNNEDPHELAVTLTQMAKLYEISGQPKKAFELARQAYGAAGKSGNLADLITSSELLYKISKKNANHKEALFYFEKYTASKDSLQSEDNKSAVIRQKFNYEYEKKAAADSVAFALEARVSNAQIATQKAELAAKDNRQRALAGGLVLVLVFAGFIFNRYRVTRTQKRIIEVQKTEVEAQKTEADKHRQLAEEKNEKILESISYAKRIQTAILPPPRVVKEYLKDSFILYLPKDIVAGDFYWMEQHEERVMFAAADCTGHGVPGAMVSVICNNGLNRAVREFGLTNPGDILDMTRQIVMQEFEKSDEEVKDGMDISLCVMEGYQLLWAGANNPLWIVRGDQLLEYKADKQPIGKYAANAPFTTHALTLLPGDTLYSFTDGYQDQFGGEHLPGGRPGGVKYKAKALKAFLLSIAGMEMADQRDALLRNFDAWRGALEQIDDVCILAVRV